MFINALPKLFLAPPTQLECDKKLSTQQPYDTRMVLSLHADTARYKYTMIEQLHTTAAALLKAANAKGFTLALAESCTGGLVAAQLTAIAGASHVFELGFITYSNRAKTELLGVPTVLIETNGAVSAEVAQAMAQGTRECAKVDIAAAVTGIAGPGGGSPQKPIGLVFIGIATLSATTVQRFCFSGDRDLIRLQATLACLQGLVRVLG